MHGDQVQLFILGETSKAVFFCSDAEAGVGRACEEISLQERHGKSGWLSVGGDVTYQHF